MAKLSETALIREYLAPISSKQYGFGLKDDAAYLPHLPATGLIVTADAIVAGVHFFENDSPCDVAYKAVAVNVSDLAAKAAMPLAYTMTLGLNAAPTREFMQSLSEGLVQAHDTFGIQLIGGDTVSTNGAWWIAITAFGTAPSCGLIQRAGATPGDWIYVSGTLGDSALGLKLRLGLPKLSDALPDVARDFLLKRYLRPEPRLEMRQALASFASAAMDISDGLAMDLGRLCAASTTSADIWMDRLPLSNAARVTKAHYPDLMNLIVGGGDDYEILATVSEASRRDFEAACLAAKTEITHIGLIKAGANAPRYIDSIGNISEKLAQGYEHFKE